MPLVVGISPMQMTQNSSGIDLLAAAVELLGVNTGVGQRDPALESRVGETLAARPSVSEASWPGVANQRPPAKPPVHTPLNATGSHHLDRRAEPWITRAAHHHAPPRAAPTDGRRSPVPTDGQQSPAADLGTGGWRSAPRDVLQDLADQLDKMESSHPEPIQPTAEQTSGYTAPDNAVHQSAVGSNAPNHYSPGSAHEMNQGSEVTQRARSPGLPPRPPPSPSHSTTAFADAWEECMQARAPPGVQHAECGPSTLVFYCLL